MCNGTSMRLNDITGKILAADIEERAQAIGISINELCRLAHVARSTFTRWKSGATEPQIAVYRRLCQKLDDLTPTVMLSS